MSSAADRCSRLIADAFAAYNAEFRAITRRAPVRFEALDWKGAQRDAVERIELYDRFVDQTVAGLRAQLGDHAMDRALWRDVRAEFAREIDGVPDAEFTKTFFSSITRTLFGTVGVDADIEFIAADLDPLDGVDPEPGTTTYVNRGNLSLLVEDLLGDLPFRSPWRDFEKSVQHVVTDITAHLQATSERRAVQRVEMIGAVFYQFTRAYLVGRITGRDYVRPLVIALKNTDRAKVITSPAGISRPSNTVEYPSRSGISLRVLAPNIKSSASTMKDFPVSEGPRTSVTDGPNSTRAGCAEVPTNVRWVSFS